VNNNERSLHTKHHRDRSAARTGQEGAKQKRRKKKKRRRKKKRR
jgi:hypothetical protein